jgi:hypothetical protein
VRELSDTHIKAAVDLCRRVVEATDGVDPSAQAMGTFLGALRALLGAPEPLVELDEQWVTFYGGPDPDNCAGRLGSSDHTTAESRRRWMRQAGVAHRTLYAGPWQITKPSGVTDDD